MSQRGDGARAGFRCTSPEATVHNFFRKHSNHFPRWRRAPGFWDGRPDRARRCLCQLKARLRDRLGLRVRLVPVAEMPGTLREYDEAREVRLSEALDHPNRVFQLVHVSALVEHRR
jgi:predicted transcriptional regulator